MKRVCAPFWALGLSLLATASPAQERLIGLAAPLSGPSAILGAQVAAGAGAAAGESARVVAADTECTADGGAGAANEFVAAGAQMVVGFLCTAAIEAALPILTEAGIPVIDVGVRANRLTDRRERTGHLVWRIAPRSDAEADALAAFVRTNWRDVPFGIVEDGSAYGRDLADEVRARLGADSIEPALVDNYRPAEEVQFALARRIEQSGVTRLLVFGAQTDIAILARDAAEIGLELDLVGGESLIDAPSPEAPLPRGIRAVGIDDGIGTRSSLPGDGERVTEGYFAPAYAATQIALDVAERRGQAGSPRELLDGGTFETILGPVRFDDRGDSTLNRFGLLVWDGQRFVPAPQS